MKIFVDDIREPPTTDWIVFRCMDTAFEFWSTHRSEITEISLDHDMGASWNDKFCGFLEHTNGYQFLVAMERTAFTHSSQGSPISIPLIHIHSANPQGRLNMEKCLESMKRFVS